MNKKMGLGCLLPCALLLCGAGYYGFRVEQIDGGNSGYTVYDNGTTLKRSAIGGDLVGSMPNPTLASTITAGGPIGDGAHVPAIIYDAKGRLTTVTNTAIALPASAITSGLLALARGGTNADLSATGGANQVVKQTSAGAAFTVADLVAGDIPSLDTSKLTTGTLGTARGGTGLGSYVAGDLPYASATNVLASLGIGSTNQVLAVTGGLPSWKTTTLLTLPTLTGSTQLLYDSGSGTAALTGGITFPGTGQVVFAPTAAVTGVTVNPTNTAATCVGGTTPASFAGNLLNFLDNSGNSTLKVTVASNSTTIGYLLGENNVSAGAGWFVAPSAYRTSGNTLSFYNAGYRISGTDATSGRLAFLSAENNDGTHLGTDLFISTTATGSTSTSTYWKLTANGNTVLNGTGSALATNATNGFTYPPNMAGNPSGSPTAYTGSTPLVYDSTNHAWWAYDSTNWITTNGNYSSTAGGTATVTANVDFLLISGGTFTITLASAASRKGRYTTFKCDTNGFAGTVTLARAGSDTIDGSTSYTGLTATGKSVTLYSDGTNYWITSKV